MKKSIKQKKAKDGNFFGMLMVTVFIYVITLICIYFSNLNAYIPLVTCGSAFVYLIVYFPIMDCIYKHQEKKEKNNSEQYWNSIFEKFED